MNLLAVETETRDSKLHVSVYNARALELFEQQAAVRDGRQVVPVAHDGPLWQRFRAGDSAYLHIDSYAKHRRHHVSNDAGALWICPYVADASTKESRTPTATATRR